MRCRGKLGNKMFIPALVVGVGGSLGSILPDFDHITTYYQGEMQRGVLHSDISVIVFICVAVASLCGLCTIRFLRR